MIKIYKCTLLLENTLLRRKKSELAYSDIQSFMHINIHAF